MIHIEGKTLYSGVIKTRGERSHVRTGHPLKELAGKDVYVILMEPENPKKSQTKNLLPPSKEKKVK